MCVSGLGEGYGIFWGLFWCWPVTFIEWQHLLQVGWRSVRIGMACTGRAIIRIEVKIYWLDNGPIRPLWMITMDACVCGLFDCGNRDTLQAKEHILLAQ